MYKYSVFFLLIVVAGCVVWPSDNTLSYTGVSRHRKCAKGDSNFPQPYKQFPALESYSIADRRYFETEVERYLDGVENDLETVEEMRNYAHRKINSVIDAANSSFEVFILRYVDPPLLLPGESNLRIFAGYPEFCDFDYRPPFKPFLSNDQLSNQSYIMDVANFVATIKDYIEDGEHYMRNCENDYNEIKKIWRIT